MRDYKSHVFMFNVRSLILSLPKKCMVAIWTIFDAWSSEHEVPDRIVVLIKDIIAFKKRASPIETNNVDKPSKNTSGFLNICYHNKGIEMVNIPRILNSRYVRDAVPQFINDRVPPTISYKYTKAIGGRIFNQKKVVEELDIDRGAGNMCCDCSTSKYCYEPAGHVITGDLTIVKDAELRGLIEKGPSFREQNYININENLCKEAVAKYKRKWSRKERVDIRVLNEWECKVNECIEKRIRSLKSRHINRRKKHILKSEKHLKSLQELHSKYVLVPADKASSNVIVVCKKYYLEVVLGEVNTTTTYEHVAEDYSELVNEHLEFMAASRIVVQPDCRCLPQFYWLPKLHKKPYGARFIAASHKCTTKPLSKLLTSCLKLITNHFRQYCNGIFCRTGVNCFWIIDNSQQVLSTINKINYFSTAKHLDSYDFSTLYTSIPHDSLKQALKSLITEAYKVRDSVFLVADHAGRAYWSNIPSSSKHSITEEQLVAYVEYLIDNIYVSIGNRVYRQCVGIPMGTDCAPLLANLFLFYYEYGYMKGLIKTDLVLAKKFNNTMRYIDDLLTLNNATFHSAIADIYPRDLQLKKTTECETQLSYLDILVTIENRKYSTAVYDKRDNFNFNIVNFPYLSSNIPSGPAYGVYVSQLVRIGRICSNYTQFARRHYKLTQRLIHQGFRYSALCVAFRKFAKKYTQVLEKYGCSIRKHIEDGVCLPAMDPFLSRHVSRRSF